MFRALGLQNTPVDEIVLRPKRAIPILPSPIALRGSEVPYTLIPKV